MSYPNSTKFFASDISYDTEETKLAVNKRDYVQSASFYQP